MPWIPVRAIIGVMIFLGYFVSYLVRYNISVHIIDMVLIPRRPPTSVPVYYYRNNDTSNALRSPVVLLAWDEMKLAKLLSAYFIGYCICFPIFHNWGDKLGPKWVAGIAGLLSGILNCLTPVSTYTNFWLLMMVRIGSGFCAGATHPCMVQVLRYWVPPVERNHFMYAYCGLTAGTFSTLLFCAAIQYKSRWIHGFYATGALQMTWAIMWVALVTDHPQKHPCLPEAELQYLESTIGEIFTIRAMNTRAPWRLILRSVEFWALVILNFGYAWFSMAVCLYGPLYYSEILGFSIFKAAVLTSIPFLLRLILGTVVIQFFHWLKYRKRYEKLNQIWNILVIISHIMPGLLIMSVWCFKVVPGPVLLTAAVTMTAASMDLTLNLCYEIAPTYANSLNTVIKIIGNTPGVFVSYFVGGITKTYGNTFTTWKHIWCVHGTVIVLSGVFFIIWGNTKVQAWNTSRTGHVKRIKNPARPSTMSNITEIDEENPSIHHASMASKKKLRISYSPIKI